MVIRLGLNPAPLICYFVAGQVLCSIPVLLPSSSLALLALECKKVEALQPRALGPGERQSKVCHWFRLLKQWGAFLRTDPGGGVGTRGTFWAGFRGDGVVSEPSPLPQSLSCGPFTQDIGLFSPFTQGLTPLTTQESWYLTRECHLPVDQLRLVAKWICLVGEGNRDA